MDERTLRRAYRGERTKRSTIDRLTRYAKDLGFLPPPPPCLNDGADQ